MLDPLEPRSLVAEPVNVFSLSLGVPMGLIGAMHAENLAKANIPSQALQVTTVTPSPWEPAPPGDRASLPHAAPATSSGTGRDGLAPSLGTADASLRSPGRRTEPAPTFGPTPTSGIAYGTDSLGLGKGHPASGQAATSGSSGPMQQVGNNGSARHAAAAAAQASGSSQASAAASAGALSAAFGLGRPNTAPATTPWEPAPPGDRVSLGPTGDGGGKPKGSFWSMREAKRPGRPG
ncbi:hypothetical protein OJF2_77690 [Aquisphaera giovannonii]|uniref:Uncharacterized protein n=1 Tax=Aquisphaera giovannonii TaxID=406548 RepID=A0A5B9WF37_9BACT|nr:hypothetical protein [Aquisphaera giovannonii]QEH39157.1 hypothetical protein OJF2_77690 [Aquisphaera giovannonii]